MFVSVKKTVGFLFLVLIEDGDHTILAEKPQKVAAKKWLLVDKNVVRF